MEVDEQKDMHRRASRSPAGRRCRRAELVNSDPIQVAGQRMYPTNVPVCEADCSCSARAIS
jgi:hypothetical protein